MSSADANPELPEPTATGTFAKTPLAHLLVYAQDRELTGTFDFAGPTGQSATVLFIEGQPTKARVSDAAIYLGRVLFEIGVLSEDQLGILLPRLLGSNELHGQVLLSEGLITEEQLELGLRAQLVRQMQCLVRLPPETTYKYYDCFDGLASYGGDGHVGIDPFPVVWACIRDEPPWEHVQIGLSRVGALGLKLTPASETSRFAFDKAERATVELLRQRPWRLLELTATGTLSPRLVQLLVYCLLVTKQVELVRESKLPEAPPSDAELSEPPPSSPFATGVLESAAPQMKVARVQLAQRPITRVIVEEDSGAAQMTQESADGRTTSYVATQPRSFTKKRARTMDATASVAAAAPPGPSTEASATATPTAVADAAPPKSAAPPSATDEAPRLAVEPVAPAPPDVDVPRDAPPPGAAQASGAPVAALVQVPAEGPPAARAPAEAAAAVDAPAAAAPSIAAPASEDPAPVAAAVATRALDASAVAPTPPEPAAPTTAEPVAPAAPAAPAAASELDSAEATAAHAAAVDEAFQETSPAPPHAVAKAAPPPPSRPPPPAEAVKPAEPAARSRDDAAPPSSVEPKPTSAPRVAASPEKPSVAAQPAAPRRPPPVPARAPASGAAPAPAPARLAQPPRTGTAARPPEAVRSAPPASSPSSGPRQTVSASDAKSGEVITAPPPAPDGERDADIFHIPTPAKGLPAVDPESLAPPPDPRPPARKPAEVHERPTVPKMAVVTPEQIAEFKAAAAAKAASAPANAPAAADAKPPPLGEGRAPSSAAPTSGSGTSSEPQSLNITTPFVGVPPTDAAPKSSSAPASLPPNSAPPSSSPSSKSHPISLRGESIDDDAPPSSRASGPSSIRAMQMTAELVARKKEIQDKAAASEKEDYYALLGVPRDAPSAEIQKTFFGLAKKWHPDRVPPALADVKDLCAKVFARMSEAHQTLMDPTKRAKYDAAKKPGGDDSPEAQAEVQAILEASVNFQKAEICLRRNDFKQAEELCKKALDADPKQADYIAMMVWLQVQKPNKQDQGSMQAQVAELTRAIGISQACERAFFYRAMLLKRLGQEPQAMKDFKRALELNSRNVDAQRELRLYNMRGGASQKPKDEGGGIFGKLFKK